MTESNVHAGRWTALAGPREFGRSLLVFSGEDAPFPWADCERIHLTESSIRDTATLVAVRRAFLNREPVIFDIDPTLKAPEPGIDHRDVWQVPPNADFVAEATWRLATANAVDGRDRSQPSWALALTAKTLGAKSEPDQEADISLPNGSLAWCDGGPLHIWGDASNSLRGLPVLPHITIESGKLSPLAPCTPSVALAPDQLRAVSEPSSRARIIAPAGSGKTRVLTERARHLLNSGVPVESLLLVAFNKRARKEMRDRMTEHPELQVLTINALALSILNGTNGFAGRGERLQTINPREVRDILSAHVKFHRKTNTDPAAIWIGALTQVRLGLKSPETIERAYQGELKGFAEFFPRYRQLLADRNQIDFDEQIYLAIDVLLRDPRIRHAAEKRARALLVDEFQDLTPAHMLLLRLVAGPALSIFAVGDDDQTIYGFSGATPEWLVKFEQHVPFSIHHALEVNYRCPAPVVTAASNVLSRNSIRVPKVIRSGPLNVVHGSSLNVVKSEDQTLFVTSRIQALTNAGVRPNQIAVLSRVNALLLPVQVSLVEAGLPVNLIGGIDFLRSTGVESVLAWFHLALEQDRLAGYDIKLAARRPSRGISPMVREWMGEQTTFEGLIRLAGRMNEATASKLIEFNRDVGRIGKLAEHATTSDLINFIRTEIGLDGALATLDTSHMDQNGTSTSDSLRSLVALARLHPDSRTFESWLKVATTPPPDESGVALATVHKVKGQEWPHVIVYDASDEVFPHRLSSDIEEERRIFHVAITRCQSSLVVTADAKAPSPFLKEMAAPGRPTSGFTKRQAAGSPSQFRSTTSATKNDFRQGSRGPFARAKVRSEESSPTFKAGSVEWRTKVQAENPNAYAPWSSEEDGALRAEFAQGWSVARIAEAHQRRAGAIRSRIKKLGLRD